MGWLSWQFLISARASRIRMLDWSSNLSCGSTGWPSAPSLIQQKLSVSRNRTAPAGRQIALIRIRDRKIIEDRVAGSIVGHRRDRLHVTLGQHNLASAGVNGVAWRDDYLAVALGAGDGIAASNTCLVQALVMQPAHLTVESFKCLEVACEQALA